MWVPREMVNSNTVTVLAKLECKGITPVDATVFVQALETKLMDKRKKKHATIMDSLPCDVNKQPTVTLFRTKDQGDCGCFIILDFPLDSNYTAGNFLNFLEISKFVTKIIF
jgi:hypothetical protein